MAYLALYRAWRPQRFIDVIGQQHIIQTLQNSLKEKRFAHAYLFSGPRGTGKTSTAKIFAKAVNCEHGPVEEPCNECKVCKGITEGTIFDVVEIDAASNRGVEEIRDLREKVKFAPNQTRYKVYIIDEVHMLTTEAFNALLKTLEEPPEHVIFILATTEPHKIPLTIISRCQRFDFRRITIDDIVQRLAHIIQAEGFTYEQEALTLIAKHSEGGMRDSLSLLDQVLSFSGDHITVDDVLRVTGRVSYQVFSQIAKDLYDGNTAKVLDEVTHLFEEGKDPEKIIEDLLLYYRDLLLYRSAPQIEEIRDKSNLDQQFPIVADYYSEEQIYEMIEIFNKYLNEMKWTNQPRILLELAIVKASKMNKHKENQQSFAWEEIEQLKKRVQELEEKLQRIATNETNIHTITKSEEKPLVKQTSFKVSSSVKQLVSLSKDFSEKQFQKLKQDWPEILQVIKRKKITVHAWLMDGEPVAATEDTLVIAFKNVMHRDTTDKPAHRQLIESVITDKMGTTFRILNLLKKDWQKFIDESEPKEGKTDDEHFVLEPEYEDEIVAKAIELFGKDLVEIKD
ncbi:DNA polymerase III subunit gamma/tau [Tepidibacillus fermentans]|uniref:DNA-directed DNA polymerase n=1 Tax=Tepidibacillus fermentans TaxID=1281767 RepID=A0A4R3K5T5_9BACI|nr:DNA polymerase III subunit gamma/tau [Tepidibacillus fermentans]TCS78139.1 DNA polymerase III tau subunit [Tepidibacillus fermentans]